MAPPPFLIRHRYRLFFLLYMERLIYWRFIQRYGEIRFWEFSPLPQIVAALLAFCVMLGRWPLLLLLLILQHIYFGGIHHFPQFLLLSGRASLEPCWSGGTFNQEVSTYILTMGQEMRVKHVNQELARFGIQGNFVAGNPDTGILLSWRKLLEEAHNKSTTEWVLLFEDDMVLHWAFKQQVECLLDLWTDMIWLDARSHINYSLFGYTGCCMAGMLIRRAALPLIYDHLGPASRYHIAFDLEHPEFQMSPDSLLSHLCDEGVVRCKVRPLVSEYGFRTLNSIIG